MEQNSEKNTAYWLIRLVYQSINDKITDKAQEWEEIFEEADKECAEKHPDWDHKDRRWEDPNVARAYTCKHVLWELADEIADHFIKMGIDV